MAIRLALAYRSRFGKDIVVDLVGYRRHGHNEQDEPAYTQPLMAERIAKQPSVREKFAGRLVEEGLLSQEAVEAFHTVHDRVYAVRDEQSEVECVNWRGKISIRQ